MSDGQRRGDLEDLELRQLIPKRHAAMLIIAIRIIFMFDGREKGACSHGIFL